MWSNVNNLHVDRMQIIKNYGGCFRLLELAPNVAWLFVSRQNPIFRWVPGATEGTKLLDQIHGFTDAVSIMN